MAASVLLRSFFLQPKLISKKTKILFTQPQITCYSIISDLGNYPKFVSWIQEAKFISQEGNKAKYFMTIGFPPCTESYHSEVILTEPSKIAVFSSQNEVFDILESLWEFAPVTSLMKNQDGQIILCEAMYSVKFKFSNPVYQKFSSVVINKLFSETSKAFVKFIELAPRPYYSKQ
jgi:ribosome-associated toxin RatA of RatAB toxin-antitoxin module